RATSTSTASSTPSRPIRHSSKTRRAYCSIDSGWVLATTSTCSWLPLLRCRSSACRPSAARSLAARVPVVSTTGESSGGMATSCWARAGNPATAASSSASSRAATLADAVARAAVIAGGPSARGLRLWLGRRGVGATEVDRRRLLDGAFVLDADVRPRAVAEHLRDQVLRERAHVRVVVLHQLD